MDLGLLNNTLLAPSRLATKAPRCGMPDEICLAVETPTGNRNLGLDDAVSDAVHPVVQVDSEGDVVGQYLQSVADVYAVIGTARVQDADLLGEPPESEIGLSLDNTEGWAPFPEPSAPCSHGQHWVSAESLIATVYADAVGGWLADDCD